MDNGLYCRREAKPDTGRPREALKNLGDGAFGHALDKLRAIEQALSALATRELLA